MSRSDREMDRLKRIRDRQLQLRDPQTKAKKLQHNIAVRRKRSVKRFSFGEVMREIPKKWWGLVIGMALGVGVFVLLPFFVESAWTDTIGFAAIVFLAILGVVLGNAMDVRDRLNELMR
ncbi:MAG: hypothetical protein GTO14_15420 [Anaerolineales bacterium]|nr:hypothetical protein [Anaerolineales bacterium]